MILGLPTLSFFLLLGIPFLILFGDAVRCMAHLDGAQGVTLGSGISPGPSDTCTIICLSSANGAEITKRGTKCPSNKLHCWCCWLH